MISSPPLPCLMPCIPHSQENGGPGGKQSAHDHPAQTRLPAGSSPIQPKLTTEPGSLRSCADSPRSSVSDLYNPSSFSIHRLRLVLSEPASAHGQST